ncbi:iron-siderophore ABC transporter substrate-binding protein [Actinoalloteichus spitiensis]|uniref:iron-siderophore ABC transporter substrate-binding protein n=1 Tax=Actinoalloteichus spitiensis TaxID=252394 RepID=UPI00037BD739|nr:iron-siderophore ABC transporter substrate-binding protein [Actinoalloteichus spitiensis]
MNRFPSVRSRGLTRRHFLAGGAGAAVALLAGCADGSGGDDGAPAGSATPGAGGFPTSVDHQFGTTELERAPERVVALGWGDGDTLLALGVVPVASVDWFRAYDDGFGPWAREKLGDGEVDVLTGPEFSPEGILAQRPDLVTMTKSDNDRSVYEMFAELVPTLSGPATDISYGTHWRDQTRLIAEVLGRPEDGQVLIGEVENAFADARARYPRFEGRTCSVVWWDEASYAAYVEGDTRVDTLRELGFVNAPAIEELRSGNGFTVDVSREEAGLLEADVCIVVSMQPAERIEQDTLFQGTAMAREGRVVVLSDADAQNAFSMGTVLSLPYALDLLLPLLDEALAD